MLPLKVCFIFNLQTYIFAKWNYTVIWNNVSFSRLMTLLRLLILWILLDLITLVWRSFWTFYLQKILIVIACLMVLLVMILKMEFLVLLGWLIPIVNIENMYPFFYENKHSNHQKVSMCIYISHDISSVLNKRKKITLCIFKQSRKSFSSCLKLNVC